jgi:hypothetical protein
VYIACDMSTKKVINKSKKNAIVKSAPTKVRKVDVKKRGKEYILRRSNQLTQMENGGSTASFENLILNSTSLARLNTIERLGYLIEVDSGELIKVSTEHKMKNSQIKDSND